MTTGLPKGKQDKGELLQETAVRRSRKRPASRFGSVESSMSSTTKSARAKTNTSAIGQAKSRTRSTQSHGLSKQRDCSGGVARLNTASKMLSYSHDRELLQKLIEFHNADQLETRSLIVLRHAKATPRVDWRNGEATRPLLPEGEVQARGSCNTQELWSKTVDHLPLAQMP